MLFVDKICTHHRNAAVPYRNLLNELDEEWQIERMKTDEKERKKLTSAGDFGVRIIPAYTAVKDKPELEPWESMKAILQMAAHIAVVDCPCRIRAKGNGKCQMPGVTEVCFLVNRDAEYAVDSGSASKFSTVDEAISLVERMEKVGMIHNATNTRGIVSLLCNCCNDHCVVMRRYYTEGESAFDIHPSRYLSVVNPEFCVGCGVCVERCFFDAVTRKRDANGELKAVVDPEVCMGCGSCVVGCPHGAMDMKCIRPEDHVPKGLGTRPSEVRTEPLYEKYTQL
jgi:ferredoxin